MILENIEKMKAKRINQENVSEVTNNVMMAS